jgi:peptide-methionine (S)-S-oxide reductase
MSMSATPSPAGPGARETATLGGGCFWCTEAVFQELRGVDRVLPGYAGGRRPNPTYEEVCSGSTGHAEVVEVVFDPAQISYEDILRIFLTTHDPTTLNRQGGDSGTQYRSVILYHSPAQQLTAQAVIRELEEQRVWGRPIVTEVAPFSVFYPAEEYHRNYFRRNPSAGYCQAIIAPKVSKFRKAYSERLRTPATH